MEQERCESSKPRWRRRAASAASSSACWSRCSPPLALLAWTPAHADDSDARKAESPYFHVAGSDGSVDRLPLKSTRVDVRIAGVIADVTVTQHYRNEGQRALEARYVFPGSTQAGGVRA